MLKIQNAEDAKAEWKEMRAPVFEGGLVRQGDYYLVSDASGESKDTNGDSDVVGRLGTITRGFEFDGIMKIMQKKRIGPFRKSDFGGTREVAKREIPYPFVTLQPIP